MCVAWPSGLLLQTSQGVAQTGRACKGSFAFLARSRGNGVVSLRSEVKSATAATAGRVCDPSPARNGLGKQIRADAVLSLVGLAGPGGRVGRPTTYPLSSD